MIREGESGKELLSLLPFKLFRVNPTAINITEQRHVALSGQRQQGHREKVMVTRCGRVEPQELAMRRIQAQYGNEKVPHSELV